MTAVIWKENSCCASTLSLLRWRPEAWNLTTKTYPGSRTIADTLKLLTFPNIILKRLLFKNNGSIRILESWFKYTTSQYKSHNTNIKYKPRSFYSRISFAISFLYLVVPKGTGLVCLLPFQTWYCPAITSKMALSLYMLSPARSRHIRTRPNNLATFRA